MFKRPFPIMEGKVVHKKKSYYSTRSGSGARDVYFYAATTVGCGGDRR